PCGTRMCNSARSPDPTHVAAARLTPASLTAAATFASAPGSFSISITKSVDMDTFLPGPTPCDILAPHGAKAGVAVRPTNARGATPCTGGTSWLRRLPSWWRVALCDDLADPIGIRFFLWRVPL